MMAGAILAVSASTNAQERLRWKFEPGQTIRFKSVQEASARMEGPDGEQNVTMHEELDMTWEITRVTDEGNAEIQQKIERMKVSMALPPPIGVLEYDSESEDAPSGMATLLAPLHQALSKAEIQFTMTPRGEITNVKIPAELVAALKNIPGGTGLSDLATPEGFKNTLAKEVFVLPADELQPGQEWSTKVELSAPLGGKQVMEKTYRYEGTKEIEDVRYAVIRPGVKMSFDDNPQLKVAAHESSGEIQFKIEAGRLHSSVFDQSFTLEQEGGVKATIDQSMRVQVVPAEETN
jgi:hypothetical protein